MCVGNTCQCIAGAVRDESGRCVVPVCSQCGDPTDYYFRLPSPAEALLWTAPSIEKVLPGQAVPETKGAIARCAIESLALKCRYVMDRLIQLRGAPLSVLHTVGGGTQNALLCQCIANATGLPVVAGPVEATAIGNLLVQAMAGGELSGLDDIREVVRRSFPLITYEPQETEAWSETYERFRGMVDRNIGITDVPDHHG